MFAKCGVIDNVSWLFVKCLKEMSQGESYLGAISSMPWLILIAMTNVINASTNEDD